MTLYPQNGDKSSRPLDFTGCRSGSQCVVQNAILPFDEPPYKFPLPLKSDRLARKFSRLAYLKDSRLYNIVIYSQ